MHKIYTLIVLMAVVLLGTSCNDEWKEEQYDH